MFDLHITCTKDISFLKINFADGTSVISEDKSKNKKDAIISKTDDTNVKTLNTSSELKRENDIMNSMNARDAINKKKVKLPEIKEKHRDKVKVADELQNLEI